MLSVILTLIVIGVLLWLVNAYIPRRLDEVSILHLPPFLEIMSDSVCAHLSIEYKNDTISPGLYTNCRWECVLCGTRFVPEPLHRHLMIELESQLRNEFIRSS
jgi:hypothetical protein